MKKLGYTGGDHNIIRHMDWGYKNYHRQKPNDQFSSSIILKSSPEKPFGDKDGRIRKKDVMIVLKELMRQLKANKLKLDKKPVYRPDRNNPMIEFRVDPKSVMKESVNEFRTNPLTNKIYKKGDTISYLTLGRTEKGKAKVKGVTKARPNRLGIKNHYITNKGTFSDMEVVGTKAYKLRFKGNTEKKVMKAMGVKEGFGSDEFLTKTEKKKFEKERLENAEVLGYELTGTKDIKESINESKKEKDQIIKYLQGLGFNERTAKNAVAKSYNYISKAYRNTGTRYKGDLIARILNKKESVFAVRQDKIKNGERFPKEPNFDYDPEKGKSRIRKVNEMTTSQARDTLNHLGGKRFIVMTGAKPLTIDKKRKELLFKIGRNAKGINLVTIRLTSLDLYDMEFAQVRMGNKKVKAVEKRVYGDQLQKFFKKHTGMNTYL